MVKGNLIPFSNKKPDLEKGAAINCPLLSNEGACWTSPRYSSASSRAENSIVKHEETEQSVQNK